MPFEVDLFQREKISQYSEINRDLARVSDEIAHDSIEVDINSTMARSIDLVNEHGSIL